MRCYERLSHAELLTVIGACRVGLCTSRTESQHLAGIEMGACGLPMVAPRVGVYWKGRENVNSVEREATEAYTVAVRAALETPHDPAAIRESWRKEFDIPVIKEQWMKLVAEVECSGAS
jgi:glycosyltransferase involved in cell wall biosynthesis